MIERKYKYNICGNEPMPEARRTSLAGFDFGPDGTIRDKEVIGVENHICMLCLYGMRELATKHAAALNQMFQTKR